MRLSTKSRFAVTAMIDVALRESLTGFSTAQVQIREQFFSALTHDLRTPLAAASAAVTLIYRSDDPMRVRHMAEIAMRDPAWAAKERWGGMVDLLVADIATPQRGRKDFPSYLRGFASWVAMVEPKLGKRLQAEVKALLQPRPAT